MTCRDTEKSKNTGDTQNNGLEKRIASQLRIEGESDYNYSLQPYFIPKTVTFGYNLATLTFQYLHYGYLVIHYK